MLVIVKNCIKNNSFNSYYQSQRDKYGIQQGIFYQIKNTDIVMVLDKDSEVILFQLSDAFTRLLTKRIERDVVQALETYSTLQAVPLPDMTRHGLHYIDWLLEHPEFDFRRPENDPRLAKSGVYHFGTICSIGDPNGKKSPGVTRDSSRAIERAAVADQYAKLRHGAFRACTEMLNHVFRLLDPNLLEEYKKVGKELVKPWRSGLIDTGSQDETFLLRAVLINLMTDEHKDLSDWHYGLAGIIPIGSFEGGDLLTRELGLQTESKPGCLQLFRGRELRHSITKWTGRRFVVTSSTHEAVKRWAFRRMGQSVSDDIPEVNDCFDVDQEDIRPEEQRILSEQERIPERYMENSDESDFMLESDTSLGASDLSPNDGGTK
ncbi:hypothetical protein F5B20DRAFT_534916 [Whalleya microplaca]|nr:hypothetical protein F5B20DRAFT_534916 [Whalleya microplaca]